MADLNHPSRRACDVESKAASSKRTPLLAMINNFTAQAAKLLNADCLRRRAFSVLFLVRAKLLGPRVTKRRPIIFCSNDVSLSES